MDEFDKIREFSEGITNRKEPFLSKEEVKPQNESENDDASLYNFVPNLGERLGNVRFDDLEEKRFSSMKLHFVALGIFVGVLVIVLGGFLMFGTSDDNEGEIITINATAEPVKVKPEQPGGMTIPDQDKMVYNRIRTNAVDTKVENLFPEPEQPVMPNILTVEKNAPTAEFIPMEEVQAYNPLTEKTEIKKEKMPSAPVQKVEQVPLVKADETPKVEPKKTIKSTAPTQSKITTENSGVWTAQLMSSSNKTTVEQAWPKILAKHKALLSDMSHKIVKAEISGKGTFYRLQIGSFKTRDMANALCKKLKAQKQDCIPAKR